MYTRNHYFFEAGGYEFESQMTDIVSVFARHVWGNKAVMFSTERQDRYEGTDLFVLGVPLDITLAFDKKNKTRKLSDLTLNGVTISFGVRFGNGKVTFETPVLVVGVETAVGITKGNMWAVLDTIKHNMQKILDIGMDSYFLETEA
ncbi:MAG: hypothetical protein FWG87_01665 [Defluviitaleaceae bacterium]|nr:hypothetical protein [Defluviitaleaceae bacterium]